MARGAAVMAKALTGEALGAPVLIFGTSVSEVHKVHGSLEWLQSCLFCNRHRAAISWGNSHLPQVVFLQVYILLKTCFCESLVLPRRVISLYYYHEKVFVCSCFHSALPSDAGTAHLDRCDPSVAQRDSS